MTSTDNVYRELLMAAPPSQHAAEAATASHFTLYFRGEMLRQHGRNLKRSGRTGGAVSTADSETAFSLARIYDREMRYRVRGSWKPKAVARPRPEAVARPRPEAVARPRPDNDNNTKGGTD